ncbi:sigma-70 family RNA polymerase sigma factor [Saccharothrix xinjiangensis]|uniref:RNA polymerase sigma factor n=1 Tax=Saccharothrix xinjiangensis TaxID=204798 RepID=A0ABV9Y112_9PSEU
MSVEWESAEEEARDAPVVPTRLDVAALYLRYHAILDGYARRYLPLQRHDDAKDAVMTVFRRLTDMKAKGTLHDQPNWEAYLKRAARNACLDIVGGNRDHEELDPEDLRIHRDAAADPTGDSVVDAILRREKLVRAVAALDVLDAIDTRLRPIVIGRLFEERTDRDIGEQLGITGQRVGQLYKKALPLLQEEVNRTNGR